MVAGSSPSIARALRRAGISVGALLIPSPQTFSVLDPSASGMRLAILSALLSLGVGICVFVLAMWSDWRCLIGCSVGDILAIAAILSAVRWPVQNQYLALISCALALALALILTRIKILTIVSFKDSLPEQSEQAYERYYDLLNRRSGETLSDLSSTPIGTRLSQKITETELNSRSQAAKSQTIEQALYERKRILITGPAGIGKSYLAALALIGGHTQPAGSAQTELAPVVVRLIELGQRGRTDIVDAMVRYISRVYRIPMHIALKLFERERLSIFLDGLDRCADDRRNEIAQSIARFAQNYGATPIIVASRDCAELAMLRAEFDVEYQVGSLEDDLATALRSASPSQGIRSMIRENADIEPQMRTPFWAVALMRALGDMSTQRIRRMLGGATQRRDALADAYLIASVSSMDPQQAVELIAGVHDLVGASRRVRDSSIVQPDLVGPDWMSRKSRALTILATAALLWIVYAVVAILACLPLMLSASTSFSLATSAALALGTGVMVIFWSSHGGLQPADVLSTSVNWTLRGAVGDGGWFFLLAAGALFAACLTVLDPVAVAPAALAVGVVYALGLGDRAPQEMLGSYTARMRTAAAVWMKHGVVAGLCLGASAVMVGFRGSRHGVGEEDPISLFILIAFALIAGALIATMRIRQNTSAAPRRTVGQQRSFYALGTAVGAWFAFTAMLMAKLMFSSHRIDSIAATGVVLGYSVLTAGVIAAINGLSLRIALEGVSRNTAPAPFSPVQAEALLEQAVALGIMRRVGVGYVFYHDLLEDRIMGVSDVHEIAAILAYSSGIRTAKQITEGQSLAPHPAAERDEAVSEMKGRHRASSPEQIRHQAQ